MIYRLMATATAIVSYEFDYPAVTISWPPARYEYVTISYDDIKTARIYSNSHTIYNLALNRTYTFTITPAGGRGAFTATATTTPTVDGIINTTYDSSSATVIWSGRYSHVDIAADGVAATSYAAGTYYHQFSDISGNFLLSYSATPYDGTGTAATTTATGSVWIPIQSPQNITTTYDSSFITTSFTAPKNGGTNLYFNERVYWAGNLAAAGNTISLASPATVTNLYGNQQYVVNLQTVADGNTTVSGNTTVFLPVRAPDTTTWTTDSSSIKAVFTAPPNSGISQTYKVQTYFYGNSAAAGNVWTAATPPTVTGLYGNQPFYAKLTTVVDGNTAVGGNTLCLTAVQKAQNVTVTRDSSAVFITFAKGKNSNVVRYLVYIYDTDGNTLLENTVLTQNNGAAATETVTYSLAGLSGNQPVVVKVLTRGLIEPPNTISYSARTTTSLGVSFSPAGNNTMATSGVTYTVNGIHPTYGTTTANTYSSSPIWLYNLSGATSYIVNVSTNWDGNSATSGNTVIATL